MATGRAERMTADSYHERLAFAVAGSVLGVTVEPYDRNGRQRAVDAILHYADGRKAALEVSATGPDSETRVQHYLGQRGHSQSVPGVTGTWIGSYRGPSILLIFERSGRTASA